MRSPARSSLPRHERLSPDSPFHTASSTRVSVRHLPGSVWALGFVSMFMDVSSELVHSLLPVFMSSVLGASMLTIGAVEGVAEATASITKVFSGVLSDYWGKRKALVALGYGLSAATKPIFPLASTVAWVAAARFTDRIGKGIRGAPRDALVADVTPPSLRGAAFGLRQALDSVGAVVGPLSAIVLMALLYDNIKAVLWTAVIPAVGAVAILLIAVREPARAAGSPVTRTSIHFRDVRGLGREYWLVTGIGAVFTLARFSDAFLILRAQSVGLTGALIPMALVVMNAVYTAGAYPAGVASDRFSPTTLLVSGAAILLGAQVVLATALSVGAALTGAALWGLHMALTQGLLSKLIADAAPAKRRGTAFGVFNLIAGVSALLASVIAGSLWNTFGPSIAFWAGAVLAACAMGSVLVYRSAARAR